MVPFSVDKVSIFYTGGKFLKLSKADERYHNLKLAENGARISLIAYIILSAALNIQKA